MNTLSYTNQQLRAQNKELANTYSIYRSDVEQYKVVVLEARGESLYHTDSYPLSAWCILELGYSMKEAGAIHDEVMACYNNEVTQ